MNRRSALLRSLAAFAVSLLRPGRARAQAQNLAPRPFGDEKLDSLATGEWWTKRQPPRNPPPSMDVPRNEVVAFAVYTHDNGVLKLSAQLFPLKPREERIARLELNQDGIRRSAYQLLSYPNIGWDHLTTRRMRKIENPEALGDSSDRPMS